MSNRFMGHYSFWIENVIFIGMSYGIEVNIFVKLEHIGKRGGQLTKIQSEHEKGIL